MNRTWISRREFIEKVGLGVIGLVASAALGSENTKTARTRRVIAMSDIHIGKVDDGQDGLYWLEQALADLDNNVPSIDYGLVLGDLTQNGYADDLKKYIQRRDDSQIPAFYELAGNHEYYNGNIEQYQTLIRSTDPYVKTDGNLTFFFMSDMEDSRSGQWTDASCDWLEAQLEKYRDNVLIVCSHQLVPNTVRKSDDAPYCLDQGDRIKEILEKYPIDLWLCGHEHHSPYTAEKITRKGNTTFINIASVSHAYWTGASGSIVMDFTEGSSELHIRRRIHDNGTYPSAFELNVPLHVPCQLDN
ncbi:metallophosphoesterase [Kiritimatiellota bacterium B12222]|nr:metallophosphoesterase [Kiritimatiellota bacterium B12222]